jgi:hypothetical protein
MAIFTKPQVILTGTIFPSFINLFISSFISGSDSFEFTHSLNKSPHEK